MDGYQVATMEDVVAMADIFVTATGCFNVLTAEQMGKMKDKAIVGNIGLSEGRLLNLGNATGHRASLCRTRSRTRRWPRWNCGPSRATTSNEVYVLPKHLDEKVARLHLDALRVRLTELTKTKTQAEYLGVDVAGPYEAEQYRY